MRRAGPGCRGKQSCCRAHLLNPCDTFMQQVSFPRARWYAHVFRNEIFHSGKKHHHVPGLEGVCSFSSPTCNMTNVFSCFCLLALLSKEKEQREAARLREAGGWVTARGFWGKRCTESRLKISGPTPNIPDLAWLHPAETGPSKSTFQDSWVHCFWQWAEAT